MTKKLKILLTEDSTVFAMGLRMALESEDMTMSHVKGPAEAMAFLKSHPETDVAIVDISLEQETDGITLLENIKTSFPSVRTMVLTHYKHPGYILLAISAGAGAFLSKDSSPDDIRKAVRKVAADYSLFFGETIPNALIRSIFGDEKDLQERKPAELSGKEMEVLQLITSGYSNSQIASVLNIAQNTVETYKERIKGKFGLDTMIECVASAVAKGMVKVK